MRLNPFYPDWYLWGLGMARHLRGDHAAACDALRRMAQPNDQSKTFHVASLVRMGETGAARREVRALRELAPDATAGGLVAPLGFRDSRVCEELAESLRAASLPG